MGLRFILNGRVIDDGEAPSQEATNTETTGVVFKKVEADNEDLRFLAQARAQVDAANAKQQAQNAAAIAMMTNMQSTTYDPVSKVLGTSVVKTNTDSS